MKQSNHYIGKRNVKGEKDFLVKDHSILSVRREGEEWVDNFSNKAFLPHRRSLHSYLPSLAITLTARYHLESDLSIAHFN